MMDNLEAFKLIQSLKDTWRSYAKAKAKYEMLDESKKSVIATEASKYDGSEAYRERMARKSDAYKDYLVWVCQARQKELELRFKIDSINMEFDYWRTQESTKRAELNNLK